MNEHSNEQGHSQRRNVEVTLKWALKVRQREGLQVRELATQTPETENQDKVTGIQESSWTPVRWRVDVAQVSTPNYTHL